MSLTIDAWFERLAGATDVDDGHAPPRLKSRIYSAIVRRLSESEPLLDLAASKAAGRGLCVFEEVLTKVPIAAIGSTNPCRVCHARVLAEHIETAPIFWPHCPYSDFHHR